MFTVCPSCGEHDRETPVEASAFVCRSCDVRTPFVKLPMFFVLGASGSGKTTTGDAVRGTLSDVIVVDSDIYWGLREDFNTPDDGYRSFRRFCLHNAFHLAQNGRPVALVGAGQPWHFEQVPERACFSRTSYLALVCDDDVLRERLLARPAWRESASREFIEGHVHYNRWLKQNARDERIVLVDTSAQSVDDVAAQVRTWVAKEAR